MHERAWCERQFEPLQCHNAPLAEILIACPTHMQGGPSKHLVYSCKPELAQLAMPLPCALRLLRCMQLQALMRTIWAHAVPILGGGMIIIAVWFLFISKVRACR